MKTIALHGGRVALVDDEDFGELVQHRWCVHKGKMGTLYAGRSAYEGKKATVILMHRQILGFPSSRVDHANGNGLDNRRGNLRPCTNSQNMMNQRKRPGTASRFKGVNREDGRWRARIECGGKSKKLGRFGDEAEAARAYDRAAREMFGALLSLSST